MTYFGERENGRPIQNQEEITPAAWRGVVGLVQSALGTALFAEDFPDRSCTDNGNVCGDLPAAIRFHPPVDGLIISGSFRAGRVGLN